MALGLSRGYRAFLASRSAPRLTRLFATREINDNFEEDPQFASGKTTLTFINKEEDGIFIDAFSTQGFRLNTGFRVMGPTAFFPKSVLHWNVKDVADINAETLSLFGVLEPKLDILVIGVGAKQELNRVPKDLFKFLLSKKINFEVLATHQALATFNFLNSERRSVAGAMIPPHYMENLEGADIFHSRVEHLDNPMTTSDYGFVDTEKGDLAGLKPSDLHSNMEEYKERNEKIRQARERIEGELKKEDTEKQEKTDSKTKE